MFRFPQTNYYYHFIPQTTLFTGNARCDIDTELGTDGRLGPPGDVARLETTQDLIRNLYLQTRLIKQIDKPARHRLSGLLTTIIGRILQNPDTLLPCQHLLAFGPEVADAIT